MRDKESGGRVALSYRGDGLVITISPSRTLGSLFLAAFLSLWLFMWLTALTQATPPPGGGAFWLVWLLLWVLGGLFATLALLWIVFGRESIELDGVRLVYRPNILGLGVRRSYDIATITGVRRFDDPTKAQMPFPVPWIYKRVAFDTGHRTVRMGDNLSDAEANNLISAITDAFKAFR